MAELQKIRLEYPVKHGEELITELVFARRPQARDIKKIGSDMTLAEILDIVGKITGQPPSVMDQLDMKDAMTVAEVFTGFLA